MFLFCPTHSLYAFLHNLRLLPHQLHPPSQPCLSLVNSHSENPITTSSHGLHKPLTTSSSLVTWRTPSLTLVTGHTRTSSLPLVTGHMRTSSLPLVTSHVRTSSLPLVTGHTRTPSLPLVTGTRKPHHYL